MSVNRDSPCHTRNFGLFAGGCWRHADCCCSFCMWAYVYLKVSYHSWSWATEQAAHLWQAPTASRDVIEYNPHWEVSSDRQIPVTFCYLVGILQKTCVRSITPVLELLTELKKPRDHIACGSNRSSKQANTKKLIPVRYDKKRKAGKKLEASPWSGNHQSHIVD
jgi:hypothetical protein